MCYCSELSYLYVDSLFHSCAELNIGPRLDLEFSDMLLLMDFIVNQNVTGMN